MVVDRSLGGARSLTHLLSSLLKPRLKSDGVPYRDVNVASPTRTGSLRTGTAVPLVPTSHREFSI